MLFIFFIMSARYINVVQSLFTTAALNHKPRSLVNKLLFATLTTLIYFFSDDTTTRHIRGAARLSTTEEHYLFYSFRINQTHNARSEMLRAFFLRERRTNINEVKHFNNPEFGNVRTIEIDGEPYFVGKDVAEILGYSNPQKAIRDHIDDEDKTLNESFTVNGTMAVLINESGLYSLILSSKLPKAKEFKHWVTKEILPSIRKTGGYSIQSKPDSYMIEDPAARARRWAEEYEEKLALETENMMQKQQISEMAPKITYYDEVLKCTEGVLVTQIAKDYGWSAKKLNAYLRDKDVQFKRNGQWLLYQRYAVMGYTKSKTSVVNGEPRINTLWTQKRRLFIYDMLKSDGVLPIIEKEDN